MCKVRGTILVSDLTNTGGRNATILKWNFVANYAMAHLNPKDHIPTILTIVKLTTKLKVTVISGIYNA
jgi:hypothetical protein